MNLMSQSKIDEINNAWNMFEEAEPDISTERLIEQVAFLCKVDASDVCEALAKE